jgi:hypothetical protein
MLTAWVIEARADASIRAEGTAGQRSDRKIVLVGASHSAPPMICADRYRR